MTTPDGTPAMGNTVQRKGFDAGDAATQARPTGGGQFSGGGEATVRGTNQDRSTSGAADLPGAQQKLRQGFANPPAEDDQFTRR